MTDPLDDEAYRRGARTVGAETEAQERLERVKRGLSEGPDDDLSPDEILDGLLDERGAADAEGQHHDRHDEDDDHGDRDGAHDEGDGRRGVVVALPAQALALWARWHGEDGRERTTVLPRSMALLRPSSPSGSPVACQAAALVESTPGFLLVERRLRAEWGLGPARDALPVVPPALPVRLVLSLVPMFLAALDERLPAELFPPEVVAGCELLPADRKAQAEIDAKWRERYPASWRRGEGG